MRVAARTVLSPLLIAMHRLDGPPRLTHIWPYPSLDVRAATRARAVAEWGWLPKGGKAFFTADMRSWICTPLPGSPLVVRFMQTVPGPAVAPRTTSLCVGGPIHAAVGNRQQRSDH